MKLYVGNISFKTEEESLKELFAELGNTVSVKIITDRETGRSRGFGFVEYETNEAGNEAIEKLNGYSLDGFQLKVNEAKERAPRGNGGGGGGRGRW